MDAPFFSVFTPTHRPLYIEDAYRSLCQQTDTDWEWVLLLNGGVRTADLPSALISDPRVRIEVAPDWLSNQGVGALKRLACERARGQWLVELDHDDFLMPQALSCIREAAGRGAEFVYSDFANFRHDGTCEVYDHRYGWQHYSIEFAGRNYTAMRAFEPTPSSLHLIFYAPNHVRAWARETYLRAGGHDPLLPVADDHDLICRTYLTGARFHHIPECLYLYRLQPDGSNTYLQRNAEIQARQQAVSNRYVYALIQEWCRREGLLMLDLGAAHNPARGFLSLDLQNAQVRCDLLRGLPFADSSIGCVRAYDFLEHIPHCHNSRCSHDPAPGRDLCTVGLMNEIYRVLVPGGWFISRTPSTDGRGAYQDPTHCSFWNPNSFWYYTRAEQARFVPGIRARFQSARIWQDYPTDWHRQHNILYVYADLVALKGQRQPGLIEW
ncbi:MAG: glycosyltransferase [Casimicrobiaceae bacterium]|nr:glycosyltransferase [Casimicrobiaceae bacterium]MDW8313254.1 glycosyltransferase [Burkholderiales bacterium]